MKLFSDIFIAVVLLNVKTLSHFCKKCRKIRDLVCCWSLPFSLHLLCDSALPSVTGSVTCTFWLLLIKINVQSSDMETTPMCGCMSAVGYRSWNMHTKDVVDCLCWTLTVAVKKAAVNIKKTIFEYQLQCPTLLFFPTAKHTLTKPFFLPDSEPHQSLCTTHTLILQGLHHASLRALLIYYR